MIESIYYCDFCKKEFAVEDLGKLTIHDKVGADIKISDYHYCKNCVNNLLSVLYNELIKSINRNVYLEIRKI